MSVIVADQEMLWCCSRCRAVYRKESAFCAADGGEVVAVDSDPMVGTEVGQYAIEAFLGQGAMGRVYRAHHKHLEDRTYAVKVLLGDLAATQEMRIRFRASSTDPAPTAPTTTSSSRTASTPRPSSRSDA